MARDKAGRWLPGSSGNIDGTTPREVIAARRLKQRLSRMADQAADTLERSVNGEVIDPVPVRSAACARLADRRRAHVPEDEPTAVLPPKR